MIHMFLPGDKVNYVGQKYSSELGSKMGVVVSKVQGEPNGVIVDFGDDAYILSINSLRRPPKDKEGVEISRRRATDEEE